MASIQLAQVAKTYDNGHTAVEDFNLEVDDGEFLVLVGPSGCGKSTTLRMIAGLESISRGQISIEGRVVNDQPPARRDIAMVFQNYALYPHMTVRQNMAFGLKMRKTQGAEIKQRVSHAAELLSISSLLDRRPKELSGGQRQRVALGRAIVRQPAAFLFDEPLSNLDAKLRIQMRKELAQLHQRLKTTTIYVTHDQVEAMTLGDRIVIMNEGRIQQVDTPILLYHSPANRFVASFIGSPPMNLVHGELHEVSSTEVKFIPANATNQEAGYLLPRPSDSETGSVVLGFRPEMLTLDQKHPRLATIVVEVVERLGNETLVYFQWNDQNCIARLPGNAEVLSGMEIPLCLPETAWYLFADDDAGSLIAQANSASVNPLAGPR